MSKYHLQKLHSLHQGNALRKLMKSVIQILPSTVASCSFGKRVPVGTGARFEIVEKKEMGLDQNAVHIYNFLQIDV
ncbi:hypothetical protein MKX03_004720 [Papaver bracteatum]|nr:hypothetical protein MKX03_004720 [Papaver bracteatum]